MSNEEIDKVLNNIFEQVSNEIIEGIKNDIREGNHIATGYALNSWKKDVTNRIIYSDSEGMYFLEYGRPPNSTPPPDSEIYEWLLLKGNSEEIAKKNAHSIARNIGKNGLTPKHFVMDNARKYGSVTVS